MRAITRAPKPKNVSQLEAFLGLVNYYHKFMPNSSTILSPLYKLLPHGPGVDSNSKHLKKLNLL